MRGRGRSLARRALTGLAILALAGPALAGLAPAWTGLTGVAQAAYRGSDGRIAIVRGGNIYSIKINGTGLARLTRDGRAAGPRWSPDGRQIAYLDAGNLWIMNANGRHKRQITSAAPGHTDARPSWSPSGRYLAFVKTARHHSYGYLTRYDTVTRRFAAFTTMVNPPHLIRVTALPAAVAWARVLNAASKPGYFLLFNGARKLCSPARFCLDALGMGHESQYRNGYPSAEDQTLKPERLVDPDWFPIDPDFATDVLTTVESCTPVHCAHKGIALQITAPAILPGAYQAVFSPTGRQIAFVRNVRRVPEIYLSINDPATAQAHARLLTAGTEPDWQPVAPFPPA
jgi:Dipeptidyl peptidase IV (DPP IV) N-terminal region/WD40-like Beta Propeller Repeat